MTKIKKYIIQFLLLLFLSCLSCQSFCQSQILNFNKTPLHEVIKTLEQKTTYIFNYDPELLKFFYFTGKVDVNNFETLLTRILYKSPYTYELDQNTVLVYHPDKKNYRICGTIKDAESKELLIAANIAATNTTLGTETNTEGFFDFDIAADKNQQIEISYLGYETKSFLIPEIKQGSCPTYFLEIDKKLSYKEILITDYILDGIQEGSSYGGFELDYSQLSKNHSTVEHDVLKTVQILPGINSIDDSATNLQIRGSSPDQNLILWEGIPIYNAGHIFGMISAINPFSVEHVHIYKGAYDPQYDNRVGGIIDVSFGDSIVNSFHGSLGTTLTEVHTNLDIPIVNNRLSLLLSGRQSISGLYESPTLQSYTAKVFQSTIINELAEEVERGELIAEQAINYHDWNAKLLYQISDRIDFKLGTYRNQQDFKYSIAIPDDPFIPTDKIEVNTNAINASLNFKQSERWSSLLSFYNSSYHNEYIREEVENNFMEIVFQLNNSIEDRSFKFSNTLNLIKKLSIDGGYEFNTKKVNLDLGDENSSLGLETKNNELANFHNLFLSTTYAAKKIRIDAGMRTSYYQEGNQWVYSPRLNLQYNLNEQWKLKADGGIYHQFISQLYDFGVVQITRDNPLWILNAADTPLSQKAHKVAAGFVFQHKGWLLDVDAYYNKTTGLSTISPALNSLGQERGFSKGNARTKGLDLLLKKRWSGVNTWINYSWRDVKNSFPEISEDPFYAQNDIRHNLSAVVSYQLKEFQFSLNANYHSGLPYSIPTIEFLDDIDPGEDPRFLYRLAYDEINTHRLAPYLRFDFSINYRPTFKIMKKVSGEFSLNFINILNRENVVAREYYLDFDENIMPLSPFIEKVLLDRTPQMLVRFYW